MLPAKHPLPSRIAQHDHSVRPALILLRQKRAAKNRLRPKHLEPLLRHPCRNQMLRASIERRIEARRLDHRSRIHQLMHRLSILKIRRRHANARQIQLRIFRMKRHHTLRVLHTRWMQQHCLNHAEDRRIRTHAKSQRQNGHNREGRRPEKLPHRIAQVINHSLQSSCSSSYATSMHVVHQIDQLKSPDSKRLLREAPKDCVHFRKSAFICGQRTAQNRRKPPKPLKMRK